ncbi:MAG: hypothetical protein K9M11_02890 [Candidatus Pacebacteria bacterium]|nr:hypothetical protein [Candidatus Paceibacterota bacterium]
MFKLIRHISNPVLKPDPSIPWETEGVFNPGVTELSSGEVALLYRAVGERDSYISHIGLAKSKDGVVFERYIDNSSSDIASGPEASNVPKPVFGPSTEFDTWATEDPRITKIGDDFYITYVAVPERIMDHNQGIERKLPLETATALLKTKDFITFENLGIISPRHSDNKDIVLFPRKIMGPYHKDVEPTEMHFVDDRGICPTMDIPEKSGDTEEGEDSKGIRLDKKPRYAMLHRPNRWDKIWSAGEYRHAINVPLPCEIDLLPTLPSIWIAWSDDLIHWTHHQLLLSPSHQSDAKIGPGLPPIETPDGWLMIYHHVEKQDAVENTDPNLRKPEKFIYSVRVALLDLENPTKIIGKLPYDILYPEAPYETEHGTEIIFPTGGFIKDGKLHVYYGASDYSIGLATGSLDELLVELKKEGIDGKTRHETT